MRLEHSFTINILTNLRRTRLELTSNSTWSFLLGRPTIQAPISG